MRAHYLFFLVGKQTNMEHRIVLTARDCDCSKCGISTGRWTWSCEETDEHWCHNCHVDLHGIEFHCPACNEDVKSIQWGEEGWCDRCEQELWC